MEKKKKSTEPNPCSGTVAIYGSDIRGRWGTREEKKLLASSKSVVVQKTC